jgi:hypothetical protein
LAPTFFLKSEKSGLNNSQLSSQRQPYYAPRQMSGYELIRISSRVTAGELSAIFFGMIVVVAGCNVLALRTVTPSNAHLPHYHFIVTEEESPRKFIALDPGNYWVGIDQYKEKLAKGLDVGPFAISCFDPSMNYPKEPIRFTYPVKCK